MKNTRTVAQKLLNYCHRNNWSGYDPYDALNSSIFEFLPFLNYKTPRLVLTQVLKRSPVNLRSLLRVPKTHNPKAIALFLMALIRLSRLGLLESEDLLKKMVDKLAELRSQGSSYWCWGYSFPWQTRTILVSRGAPNLVCTVFVANALLDAYESNGEQRCLDMAASASEYILNELFWSEDGNAIASFSYPVPSSKVPVHNANFLGAALLCRVYQHLGEEKLLNAAMKVARFSAAKQHVDGSWDYGESPTQRWVDNFHTGYNLCALWSISQCAEMSEFETNVHRGFEFYRKQFFTLDGVPRYFHDCTYPIDIHSAAQSIITLLTLRDLNEENVKMASSLVEWTMHNMWDKKGYFYYQVTRYYSNKIPYIRWSQAWMLLALATFLEEYREA